MSAQDFLVELGTEELPPKALATLGDAFLAGIEKGLQAAGLNYTAKQVYAAPRRLAVLIRQLDVQQPDRSINVDGPPVQAAFDAEGKPTQAALGFAKKCGVDLSEIDQSGAKLRFSQHIPGKATASLLPTIVEDSLNDLPIPKRMRWGARKEEFVRPTQWLVMLLGDDVVDCTILAQKAGRDSRGHRFHHPEDVRISAPANYLEDLRKAYVLADFAERRELISKRTAELAMQQEGTAIVPPALLDEVTALVEWPVPLVCSFEERFLEVPQEALITTMQDNQKYFCLLDVDVDAAVRLLGVQLTDQHGQTAWCSVDLLAGVVQASGLQAFLDTGEKRLSQGAQGLWRQFFGAQFNQEILSTHCAASSLANASSRNSGDAIGKPSLARAVR